MQGMMGDWGGWGMGIGGIFMILFWALIIFGVVALVKWIFFNGSSSTGTSGRNALDILKERYARGEINREQYEEMRRNLQS